MRSSIRRRTGTSLIESVVVIATIAVLAALMAVAVERCRAHAARLCCLSNLRELSLALHQYHDFRRVFPPGVSIDDVAEPYEYLSWRIRIMPYLEQELFWKETQDEYARNPLPNLPPFHQGAGVPFPVFSCTVDARLSHPQKYGPLERVALSSYLGVAGISFEQPNGILFHNSRVRVGDILDGQSSTLLIGERPPSNDYRYGWLYFGSGQAFSGSLDHTLGMLEIATAGTGCPPGPYGFSSAEFGVPCAFMHYWSPHDGGAHFAMADGSARFIMYEATSLMPLLATRNGAEVVGGGW